MSHGSVDSDAVKPSAEVGRDSPNRNDGEQVATPTRLCRRCGARLAASYVQGVCPRYLMGCALDETLADARPSVGEPASVGDSRLPERFGRYRVLKLIGRGAMGDVYLAHDEELDRTIAIKTPQLGRVNDPTMLERFRREAQLTAALHHPLICPVYDVGEVEGTLYYTMAYVDGWPLTRWLSASKPIALRQAANLVRKLALAMGYAHRQKIVHRDLKPANVMIDRRGEPIIMDFGLARHAAVDARLTQSNMVVGTPAYLAPELVAGQEDSPATDVYALGVVLFELLTKRLPFSGHLGEMLAQITRDPAPSPSQFRADVTPALDDVCRKSLAKNPAERYGTMEDMAEALSAAFRVVPERAADAAWPVVPRNERLRAILRRSRRTVAGAAALAGIVSVTALAAWLLVRPATDDAGRPGGIPERPPVIQPLRETVPHADTVRAEPASTDSTSVAGVASDRTAPAESVESIEPAEAFEPDLPAAVVSSPPAANVAPPRVAGFPVVRGEQPSRPGDPPRAIVTLADRMFSELRRIGDERRRILQAMIATAGRRNDDLPRLRTVAAGELAAARRLGESGDLERQDYERRIAFLNTQKKTANAFENRQLDRQIEMLVAQRATAVARLQQLELEVRGKAVEIARIDEESLELTRTIERLVRDAQQLVDQAFWTADPCETLGPEVHETFVKVYSGWLTDNPEQTEILALRALAAVRAGRADSGLRDAQRAYALQNKSSLALAAQGYAKFVKGQSAEGLAELTRAARLAPQAPYASFLRGAADQQRKNRAAALDDFAKCVSLAPQSAWAKAEWARALLLAAPEKASNVERAEELAAAAVLETGRLSWFCLDIHAAALAAGGRWEEAVEAESAALQLAPPERRAECDANLERYRARHAAASGE